MLSTNPGDRSELRPRENSAREAVELSVVVPLVDDHDAAEACLDSWNQQAVVRDRVQLVVVDHGVSARRAKRLRARLRPQDVWLEIASREESVLYDRGARAADAPLLLFTEAHCIARPEAADDVLELFRENGIAAAVVSSSHIAQNALAHAQTELEHEWVAGWPADHPRMLSLRGYAIRRQTYLELGGFQRAHGRFCETALAIAIARRGLRIGSTRAISIDHVNCPSIPILLSSLAGCARGQMVWRREMETEAPGLADAWLGDELAAARHGSPAPVAARALARAIGVSLLADRRRPGAAAKARGQLAVLPPLIAAALFGDHAVRAVARLAFARAVVRWWWARATGRALLPSYRAMWRSAFDLGFSDDLSEHPIAPAWPAVTTEEQPIAELPDGALAGFHRRERWGREGPLMRWTGPASLLRLRIEPGAHRLRLTLLAPRTLDEACLTVFLNGRRIAEQDVLFDDRSLEVRMPRELCHPSGHQELVLTCRGFRPSDEGAADRRLLGLALVGVRLAGA